MSLLRAPAAARPLEPSCLDRVLEGVATPFVTLGRKRGVVLVKAAFR